MMSIRSVLLNVCLLMIASLALAACKPGTPTPTTVPATPTEKPAPEATPTLTVEPIPAATPSQIEEYNFEVTKGIVYANVDEWVSKLDVYAPDGQGPFPVVIVVPGVGQSRLEFVLLPKALASQGAIVYLLDVAFTYPYHDSGIKRIACAVRFARATAADNGGESSRITLVGNSYGAAFGAVAALAGDEFEDGGCIETDGSALPEVLVGYEGPYDYATNDRGSALGFTILKNENPELWHATNLYTYIGHNPELQVLLLHGDDQSAEWYDFPPEVSIEFHQALVDAGYDVELIILEGVSHNALVTLYSDAFPLTVQKVMELARSPSQ
jgi:acetyl esterase/lipase